MFQDHGPDPNANLNPLQSFKIKPLGTPVFATRQVTHIETVIITMMILIGGQGPNSCRTVFTFHATRVTVSEEKA